MDANSFAYYGFSYAQVHNVSDANIDIFPTGANLFFSPGGGANVYQDGNLNDGSFDSGITNYWNFNDWQNVADFQISNQNPIDGFYQGKIQVFSELSPYDVELKQLVSVEANETYHCSFWVKSNGASNIILCLQKDTSPWNNYGLWQEISVSSEWTKYQYIFNCSHNDELARFSFMLGSAVGTIDLDQVTFEKAEDIPPDNDNLIQNHSFEVGHYAPWEMENHNDLALYYVDETNAYDGQYSFFVNPNQNDLDYQVQLKQVIPVSAGEAYYLRFWAKAESPRTVFVNLFHDGPPWNNYGLWEELNISTQWSQFIVSFVATHTGQPRFSFNFGHQDIPIWIDQVSLSGNFNDIEEVEILTDGFLSANFPNPFNPQTFIKYSGLEIGGELVIYNVKGQKVNSWELDSDSGKVSWSGIDAQGRGVANGIYFYTIHNKSQSFPIRKMILLK